jgi:carbon catabolite-derepressing protein kinase
MMGSKTAKSGEATPEAADFVVQGKKDPKSKQRFTTMYMKIQIYDMDSASGVYLVDFMCDGYETADGRRLEDKEVTSPFPFLDMAARLIMQLAEAD